MPILSLAAVVVVVVAAVAVAVAAAALEIFLSEPSVKNDPISGIVNLTCSEQTARHRQTLMGHVIACSEPPLTWSYSPDRTDPFIAHTLTATMIASPPLMSGGPLCRCVPDTSTS